MLETLVTRQLLFTVNSYYSLLPTRKVVRAIGVSGERVHVSVTPRYVCRLNV